MVNPEQGLMAKEIKNLIEKGLKSKVMEQKTKETKEHFRFLCEFYGEYHNHKETMGFSITALYLGGATLILNQEFTDDRQFILVHSFFALGGILTFLYVYWQFKMRIAGTAIFEACLDLLNSWLTEEIKGEDLKLGTFKNEQDYKEFTPIEKEADEENKTKIRWPNVLGESITRLNSPKKSPCFITMKDEWKFAWWWITLGAIIIWTGTFVSRVLPFFLFHFNII